MSLYEQPNGNGMVMPVSPMGSYGGFGGDAWLWIIVLMLFGWGGRGFGFGGGYGPGEGAVNMVDSSMQRGFDQQAVMNGINGINSTLGSMSNQLCNGFGTVNQGIASAAAGINQGLCSGFAGVNQSIFNGFANAETANNARQIANMQQSFANQTAMNQGFNSMASQFSNCCCENRLGIADLKYTVATENCADRNQSMINTRDIIDVINARTQSLEDKLCQLELDGVKNQLEQSRQSNIDLQNQLNMATFEKSQTAQNALFMQGLSNEVDALYNRLNSCPVPTTPVYGRTPIFTCNNGYNNSGYSCGCYN